jgi:hypothetical protein
LDDLEQGRNARTAKKKESAFRFNTRDLTDGDRFALAAKAIEGCRVTWDELTGK